MRLRARMPSGYGEGPKRSWLNRAKPWPMSRIVRIAGRPRKMSV
jgi:hypothetical protein